MIVGFNGKDSSKTDSGKSCIPECCENESLKEIKVCI